MRITASAPGKLVLLGEYAVLEGAPALVLAVDRRASVTLTPSGTGDWAIVSPTLRMEARLRVADGTAAWTGAAPLELAWIATLLARWPHTPGVAPQRVELQSDAFYLEHAGQRVKLGLGSSAALTVALLGALHALDGTPQPALDAVIDAHRAIQHGRGSGIDIAASLGGGLSRFQLDAARAASRTPLPWPEPLRWRCVFSGRATSTSAMLARVAAWRARNPSAFERHTRELTTIAARGANAVANHDPATFLSSMRGYADALARFGTAAATDIASHEHRAIGALADACGCVYKSCGAGGGDVGVTFGVDDDPLQEFESQAARAGFPVIGLDADAHGLEIVVND
ncbi:MAG TPA: hypothetical protein VF292_04350 [Rhodanobacteraceae bacterium]